MPRKAQTLQNRFWDKVLPEPNSGCWLWTARLNPNGYGVFCAGEAYRPKYAHRVSYEIHKGPIPQGMILMHKCDNRLCVNPDHLQAGTHKENTADMVSKGRSAYGERHGNVRVTVDIVRDIRTRGLSIRAYSRKYGIGVTTVHDIVHRKRWAHVE